MARDYAESAEWFLRESENALNAGRSAVCVRRSQEALELAAKAALRRLGIEYPHEHDVSEAIEASAERLPDSLRARIEEIKATLQELAKVRGPAFYGYEAEGIPASQAFTREYAYEILRRVRSLVELCVKFARD